MEERVQIRLMDMLVAVWQDMKEIDAKLVSETCNFLVDSSKIVVCSVENRGAAVMRALAFPQYVTRVRNLDPAS